jgi:putative transposase
MTRGLSHSATLLRPARRRSGTPCPPLSYSGYRFPHDIIQRAVWMYLRFTLSFRDVEELLPERGITVSHESIRCWVLTFGPAIARRLRARRPKPHGRWHLDEMVILLAKSLEELAGG